MAASRDYPISATVTPFRFGRCICTATCSFPSRLRRFANTKNLFRLRKRRGLPHFGEPAFFLKLNLRLGGEGWRNRNAGCTRDSFVENERNGAEAPGHHHELEQKFSDGNLVQNRNHDADDAHSKSHAPDATPHVFRAAQNPPPNQSSEHNLAAEDHHKPQKYAKNSQRKSHKRKANKASRKGQADSCEHADAYGRSRILRRLEAVSRKLGHQPNHHEAVQNEGRGPEQTVQIVAAQIFVAVFGAVLREINGSGLQLRALLHARLRFAFKLDGTSHRSGFLDREHFSACVNRAVDGSRDARRLIE